MTGIIIVVSGNIGAGKSTLCRQLQLLLRQRWPAREVLLFDEQVDPYFLDLLYRRDEYAALASPAGIATFFQTEKQHSRWRHVLEAKQACLERDAVVIMDTDPRHDAVFACSTLAPAALRIYRELFAIYEREIGFVPDVRCFLDVTAERCFKNVQRRAAAVDSGRSCESRIDLAYLQLLDGNFRDPAQRFLGDAALELHCAVDEVSGFVDAASLVANLESGGVFSELDEDCASN